MRGLLIAMALLAVDAHAVAFKPYGDVLLRSEYEGAHNNVADRDRLRLIGHVGARLSFNDVWSIDGRMGTGLKNKQNVPAITLHRFNDQPMPDRDVFLERLYVTGKFGKASLEAGKIPWRTRQVTDMFWDRHLNPIGVHANLPLGEGRLLQLASFQPLDGASDTVGHMNIVQYHHRFRLGDTLLTLSPWLVDYDGERGARYARNDTGYDNRFVRLAAKLKYGKLQLGLDLGQSLASFNRPELAGFENQKTSYAAEVKYGGLKKPGQYLLNLRFLHVERFGVISEFAQNATARFATANMEGLDVRLRRKMGKHWWLGTRFSDMRTLVGPQEEGFRFRVEAQYRL